MAARCLVSFATGRTGGVVTNAGATFARGAVLAANARAKIHFHASALGTSLVCGTAYRRIFIAAYLLPSSWTYACAVSTRGARKALNVIASLFHFAEQWISSFGFQHACFVVLRTAEVRARLESSTTAAQSVIRIAKLTARTASSIQATWLPAGSAFALSILAYQSTIAFHFGA